MTHPDIAEPLGERQAAILRAIVREFIRTGEPVGSKHLLDRARIQVSSATVRNEMARLEEMGYLAQPYTSAGRVPTDLGYRFVVDEIKHPRPLAEGQQRALAEELNEGEPASIEELLRRASEIASRFTHHAAAVLARRARSSALRRLELLPMGPRMAMAVLIADNGRVEQRMISLPATLSQRDLDATAERLNKDLQGIALETALRTVANEARATTRRETPVLDGVAGAIQSLLDAEQQVFLGGVANLAGEETFERDTLSRLYEALERQTALLEMLASAAFDDPVTVRIGSELSDQSFRSCSIVVANFGGDESARGSVSVIGPTRMDYDRVIATATAVARLLEASLGSSEAS